MKHRITKVYPAYSELPLSWVRLFLSVPCSRKVSASDYFIESLWGKKKNKSAMPPAESKFPCHLSDSYILTAQTRAYKL